MMNTGFVGGALGDHLLRLMGARAVRLELAGGRAYEGRSKLETLFGPGIWASIGGRAVIDVGCGQGLEAMEMAQRGARRVIGLDVREDVLASARAAAAARGLAGCCHFDTRTEERADVIVSIDGFEHFADPGGMLRTMRRLLGPGGEVLIAFGPPWLHPLGGHLFSMFPWAHLIFTERALLRWRSRFKHDGATRFGEVAGGLNQMTVARFCRLVRQSDFDVVDFEAVPIRKVRRLANRMTREFLTSIVRCRLVPRAGPAEAR